MLRTVRIDMRRNRKLVKTLAFILVAASLLICMPVLASYGNRTSFEDVPSGSWYYNYVKQCATYGIIEGKEDGLYHPKDNLKCGEFMKLLAYIGDVPALAPKESHWADPFWAALNNVGVLWGLNIDKTFKDLERPITRYEMSTMIMNLCFNVYGENSVAIDAPELRITDYSKLDSKYTESVVQAFGKGILDGFEDGSFGGAGTLTRAQAAAVVVRTAWPSQRMEVSYASEIKETNSGSSTLNPANSFAFKYRNMSNFERRLVLFGDGNKTYFTGSESYLSNYIVTIEVNTWYLNEAIGQKSTKVRTLQVNRLVADETKAIFQEIYQAPEKFPIKALGGARYSDTMRHAWGCAIDINPTENYYITYSTGATVGSFCWKNAPSGYSPYCITPDSSVVRAFAKYGWGWGGQGWTNSADYMHFSILSSGG